MPECACQCARGYVGDGSVVQELKLENAHLKQQVLQLQQEIALLKGETGAENGVELTADSPQ